MIRFLVSLIVLLLLATVLCFGWFLINLPDHDVPPTVKTEAIIVLTGSNGRVEHGLQMLAQGAAPVLFISGVGQHATLEQMLVAHATPAIRVQIAERKGEIVLDHVAESTKTNAAETASFVAQRQLHSLRLVTTNYHMPRSMLEFRRSMPGVVLVPDPIFPDGFHRSEWWKYDNTRRQVFTEFKKYAASLALGQIESR